jgi:hypothetical protein
MGTQEKKTLGCWDSKSTNRGVGNRQFPADKTFSYAITV